MPKYKTIDIDVTKINWIKFPPGKLSRIIQIGASTKAKIIINLA